jgi:hypothetical protein
MNKRMLINGCSFSRGPGAWPYHLGYEIINLAQAAAGNTYIVETTIAELVRRSYDAVTIMWTAPQRQDLRVTNIKEFADSKYTSEYQRLQNDWPEKIVWPENDQNYVERNWVFGCGYINGDLALRKTRVFEPTYRFQSDTEFEQGFLIKMISLQNTLKQLNIPYLFTFYHPYFDDLKKHDLFKLLDLDSIYNDTNITDIMRDNNWYDTDGAHPGTQAHQAWAEIIKNIWQQKLT